MKKKKKMEYIENHIFFNNSKIKKNRFWKKTKKKKMRLEFRRKEIERERERERERDLSLDKGEKSEDVGLSGSIL